MNEVLKEAKRIHDLGGAVHWLHPKSKRPIESGWASGPRKEWEYLETTYSEGYNVGVRLGTPSSINGKFLAVVDVDVKSKDPKHREEAISNLHGLLGEISPPSVTSGRGNGSGHFYCLTERPFKTFNPNQSDETVRVHMPSKKPSKAEKKALTHQEIAEGVRLSRAWEISLYSDGRQVVLPPSVHPDTGKRYRWETPLTAASDLPVIEFKAPETFEDVSDREASDRPPREPLLADFKVEEVDLGWLPISDEVRAAIIDGAGVEDRSGYLLRASSALVSAGLSQNEVLTVLTDQENYLGCVGYQHAQTKNRARAAEWVYRYTLAKVERERSAEGVFTKVENSPPRTLTEEEREAQDAEMREGFNWRQALDVSDKGKIRTTLRNLDLIFSNEVDQPVFVEDLFASRIEYGADTPWGGKAGEYIKDIDMLLIKRWLADTEFAIEPNKEAVLEATSVVAHRCRIHPVRDWLTSLAWDGKSRIDTWIRDFCQGEAAEPYLSQISRKFLLAMVKRVFEPGCQWDYVIVLEGKQGRYKSSIARALASDRWFMDNLPDLKDKDSMLNLQGKWLIELGELADVKRADYNLVKAYLVRRKDTVRPHYGRLMSDVPRQSVFIGTINEGQYLKDPTGNRRYWPVKVGHCDVQGLKAVRDQIFAEAMHVYKTTDEVLMLDPEADKQATEAQEERRVDDDESEMREAFLAFRNNPELSKGFNFKEFKTSDLTVGPNAPWARWYTSRGGYVAQIAAQVLVSLGFIRDTKSHRERLWRPLLNKSGAVPGAVLDEYRPTAPDETDFW